MKRDKGNNPNDQTRTKLIDNGWPPGKDYSFSSLLNAHDEGVTIKKGKDSYEVMTNDGYTTYSDNAVEALAESWIDYNNRHSNKKK